MSNRSSSLWSVTFGCDCGEDRFCFSKFVICMSFHQFKPSLPELILLWCFVAVCVWFHFVDPSQWVPLLDGANLLIHEAGHPLMGLLVPSWTVYGGTIFQLAFPLLFAWHFYQKGQMAGQAFGLIWLAENFLNIARYMADARQQQLPLVGGGMHDWFDILSRWSLLDYDLHLATGLRISALFLITCTCLRLLKCIRRGQE